MLQQYNPVVRTFGRLRAVLVRDLDLARHEVRPWTGLGDLVPADRRREVWGELRREGFRVPPLLFIPQNSARRFYKVMRRALSFGLWLGRWTGLLAAVPVGLVVYLLTRPWAVHLPPVRADGRRPGALRDALPRAQAERVSVDEERDRDQGTAHHRGERGAAARRGAAGDYLC